MTSQTIPSPAANAQPKARPKPMPRVDFLKPEGAEAYYATDSVAWDIFKNPLSLFIGGITAVLLELGEPRVREGVWGHSIFPTDPVTRMRRTGMVTHISAYAPKEVARQVIGAVTRMHEKVRGTTPEGEVYHANDPELLNWVQATVGYGFMEAYSAYARELTEDEKDRSYREAEPIARLFLATGAPTSLEGQRRYFDEMRPRIVAHPIISEFLAIVNTTPAVPLPLRPVQKMMVRAAIALLPSWTREQLQLDGPEYRLKGWEQNLLRGLGRMFERIPIRTAPPSQSCVRMGLPYDYLYRKRGKG